MNKLTKEILLILISLLPYIYLAFIWQQLPERVATHFNIEGTADGWSSRSTLLYLPAILGLGIYFLMLIIPAIDPKKKIQEMGDNFFSIRLLIAVFMAALNVVILNAAKEGGMENANILLVLMGALFAGLGNYMQTVRPNYFVGIRTPWTLESESVWKLTHRLASKVWMAGGILIVFLSLLLQDSKLVFIIFFVLVSVMVIVPVVYSYLLLKKERAG
ncbi:MAG: SdpI family protein [Saprospiraceae bacterium]|nr:SdpI family protein [Candidatus Vicinibacter affinis]MBP6174336.1 SdpI family protein [Saprospiraceae bacterium]MBK6571450.1 SdpI family protein [Candidatus Vicinibacter affinis]MBK6823387.1 SdpI family protein [Candidatus Vicinibacter affinis]MBK7800454.1 SdpI family protein [Candidatus Vicinibacter affinis]